MKENEFATVARFSSVEEAQVVKSMLSSMGVECQIVNDMVAEVLPVLNGAVRIIVNRSDLPKAQMLMEAKFDNKIFREAWQKR